MSMPLKKKILVVEDELSMREFLEILLRRNNCDVRVAESGLLGIQMIEKEEFDLVITDLKMPDADGLAVLRATKKQYPDIEVIMITAFATTETAIAAMKQGAYDYLLKPFKVDEIIATVERALEKRALVRENLYLREELQGRFHLDRLVGRSTAMQQLFSLIRKVAMTKTNVLITGESGTGKELVARAIHALSDRANHPFVPVNCGAIPESLLESELFGHVRGAFTGAVRDQDGLFAAADGGTIFLDEVIELNQPMQVKLLRVLQERKIKPVGESSEREVDVRLVAATNRPVEEEVAAGRLRSDLFYRLNVIGLKVPPLREREEDIPLLIEHFVRKFAPTQQRRFKGVTPEAMAILCGYHFPGNVRELENIIERAVTLSTSEYLDVASLPELRRPLPNLQAPPSVNMPEEGIDLDAYMETIERQIITQALQRTKGNRSDTAALLHISMRSLRYRLAKYMLDNLATGGD